MENDVPIRSVSRSLAVLKAVNASGSLSMMEISKAADVPYATAVRLVATLIHEGMVEKEPDRKNYRPTANVLGLASGYQDHSQLSVVARPHIIALTETYGWPIAVSTRLGDNMIVRECTHSLSPYTLSRYYPGFVYPLLQSAAGLVHLAFSSQGERELSRQDLADAGDVGDGLGWTSDAALDDIRDKGFATRGRNRFTAPEARNSAIAAPVFANGQLQGTLALIFLASAIRMDKAVELYAQDVMDTARAVGADLEQLGAQHRLLA